ncbi:hypothetical protein ABPG77_005666 [Micractinium sp. CCAP 211/92]
MPVEAELALKTPLGPDGGSTTAAAAAAAADVAEEPQECACVHDSLEGLAGNVAGGRRGVPRQCLPSFVSRITRSAALYSALLSLELSGSHPLPGGADCSETAGLESTLAQLLALHRRAGVAEATGASLLAALWLLQSLDSCQWSDASACLSSWFHYLAAFNPMLVQQLTADWDASFVCLRSNLVAAQAPRRRAAPASATASATAWPHAEPWPAASPGPALCATQQVVAAEMQAMCNTIRWQVKKSSKGKEKKLARKAAAERASALAARIRALEAGSTVGAELAAQYPAFLQYRRNGLACALRFFAAAELPAELAEWALALTRAHMADLYSACPGWGWSEAKKRAELTHPSARYLVLFEQTAAAAGDGQHAAQQSGQDGSHTAAGDPAAAAPAAAEQLGRLGQPLAFLHYRFEEEEGEAVLYCYEIQVVQAAQGKGVGRFLMQLLELIGRRSGVARLMLTVFHANVAATALYRRLGYVLDDDSPGALDPSGDHQYEIMTKRLHQPHKEAQQRVQQAQQQAGTGLP